jgi:putative DNA primase/helicase
VDGYRLMLEVGMTTPPRVEEAIAAYRQEADVFGEFLSEITVELEGNRMSTSSLYAHYIIWVKDNGYRPLNSRNFVGELRRRYEVRHTSTGNVVVGLALSFDPTPPYENVMAA